MKLLLLQARLWTVEPRSSHCLSVCAPSKPGWDSHGIKTGSPQPVRSKSLSILSSVWRERGWEQCARQPWWALPALRCVLALQSALTRPRGTGAQDLLKGMDSVTSLRVLLVSPPNVWGPPECLSCTSPLKLEVKLSIPSQQEGRGLGCPH